jgi:ferritin-like metal-binding protein YciE
MANSSTLHDALIDELRDLYNAEKQITRALPKMSKAATTPPLADAFETHLGETNAQIERLERAFEHLGETARGKQCEGIAGILEEGKEIMEEDFEDVTLDACLIAAAQRVEHYEIAAYGTVIAWAKAMGHDEVADLLQESLDEEKAADEKLTSLAEGGVNEQAAAAAHGEEDQEEGQEDDQEESPKKGARLERAGSKRVAKPATTR